MIFLIVYMLICLGIIWYAYQTKNQTGTELEVGPIALPFLPGLLVLLGIIYSLAYASGIMEQVVEHNKKKVRTA